MRRPTYLVATDLSPQSDVALRAAAALAARTGARLELFCAVPAVIVDETQELLARVRRGLETAARSVAVGGVAPEAGAAVVRDVPRAIVARAKAVEADLVAVGPSGVTGWKKFVLGSVTERLLRLCPQPLLVARGDAPRAPRRILAAIDRTGGSRRVLRAAIELARSCGAEVTALHVLPPETARLFLADELEAPVRLLDEERARADLKSFAAWTAAIPAQGVAVDCRVADGSPGEAIERTARDVGADLIVVGSHGRTAVHQVFVGSVARNVVSHFPGSVLVVRTHVPTQRRLAGRGDAEKARPARA